MALYRLRRYRSDLCVATDPFDPILAAELTLRTAGLAPSCTLYWNIDVLDCSRGDIVFMMSLLRFTEYLKRVFQKPLFHFLTPSMGSVYTRVSAAHCLLLILLSCEVCVVLCFYPIRSDLYVRVHVVLPEDIDSLVTYGSSIIQLPKIGSKQSDVALVTSMGL